uniref:hypothetical protein n=1 Tax=Roseivirga sp. TaxID=1964215 RepID=UPI00404729B3
MRENIIKIFEKTIKIEDGYISIYPLAKFFNLNIAYISKKIRADHQLLKYVRPVNEKGYYRLTLTRKAFCRLVINMKPNTLSNHNLYLFHQYQDEIIDYLYSERDLHN